MIERAAFLGLIFRMLRDIPKHKREVYLTQLQRMTDKKIIGEMDWI